MKKHLVLMVSLCVLLALGVVGFAQAAKKKKPVAQEEEVQEPGPVVVPEAAKRYLGQGKAIMDLAKSPQDYEEAIRVFEKAASLAPTWPDIYDDLAYAQESAGKYPEAIKSLRKYLTLAPSYVDKKNYETRIYKLEGKIKLTAGADQRLAQKLAGIWKSRGPFNNYLVIKVLGTKVQMDWINAPEGSNITLYTPIYTAHGIVGKGHFVGTEYNNISSLSRPETVDLVIDLSQDGSTLNLLGPDGTDTGTHHEYGYERQ